MDKTKVEQIKDKICDHMLSVDLDKLSMYDLNYFIMSYKSLEGMFPFSGWGFGSMGCASTASSV